MKDFLRRIVIGTLTAEARLALTLHHPKIVAVTGNVGKTTAKDAIFAVVSTKFRTRKSQKSFNSDIGVPLAILGLDNPWSNPFKWTWALVRGLFVALAPGFPELLVLEVGADKPGDISSIAKWLRPDIAVYTGVPEIPVHIANFRSREELVNEKRSLLAHVKHDGLAIVNGDDVAEATKDFKEKVVTYGTNDSYDVSASDVRIAYGEQERPVGMTVDVTYANQHATLQIKGVLGKPVVLASLAAIAVAKELGISLASSVAKLAAWRTAPGRMRILQGLHGSTIVDDSYNSSPAAVRSALEMLQEISAKRKIAILGDMRELGDSSIRAHQEVGALAARTADLLITVGEESKVLAEAARGAGLSKEKVREYGHDSSEQVGKDLASELREGDIVLVKGSQNKIRLERCVFELLADPSKAAEQLVRFDPMWRRKE